MYKCNNHTNHNQGNNNLRNGLAGPMISLYQSLKGVIANV